MTRIGVLGGSFDPPHVGHVAIAEEARLRLSLDRIVFVPAGMQWMNPHDSTNVRMCTKRAFFARAKRASASIG